MADDKSPDLSRVTRYELEDPFEYMIKGQTEIAAFIELRAPTSKDRRQCATLKQAFFQSLPSEVDENQKGDGAQDDPEGSDVIVMLSMSKDVDLGEVLSVGAELFVKGKVAYVEGEIALTGPLLDRMSNDDLEAMVGQYMVDFILRSALRKLKNS